MTFDTRLHSENLNEFERLHRAFLLLNIALGKKGRGESFENTSVSTSVTLVDLFAVRRRFGAKSVGWKLIDHLLKQTAESPRDEDGNTLLHIEAEVGKVDQSDDIAVHLHYPLQMLLKKFPCDLKVHNNLGELPFDLMIKTDRDWFSGIATLVGRYPQAATAWLEKIESPELMLPILLSKVGNHCDNATMFQLLRSFPEFADYHT